MCLWSVYEPRPQRKLSARVCQNWWCVQNAACTSCTYLGKCEKGLVWSDRRDKLTYMKPKNAQRHRQEWRGSLVSLSFQPHSSLRRCLCFSLSHRRHSQTQSCSYHQWFTFERQRICITWWDGHGRSVSRCTWSRRLAPIISPHISSVSPSLTHYLHVYRAEPLMRAGLIRHM